ncbi:patatin-like phospholipase family protein [Vibrio comitans]|nr:patatin-like phospholipase family protein [Vibrio comitans]
MKRRVPTLIVLCSALLVSACSQTPERQAHPKSETLMPLNITNARFWDGDNLNSSDYDFHGEYEKLVSNKAEGEPINYLALSGGGVNGAFSAGILNAWSETGERPEFDLISGISTGAIVSVFAYLGEDYDEALRNYYTQTSMDEMFKKNALFSIGTRNAFVDVSGFEGKVRAEVDMQMMQALAAERAKGRILIVGTTSLDNEKLALWDIGLIAKEGSPEAMALIQDIIIASSSIPGLFPAKLISISDGVNHYDEVHVDGGISRQVFATPQWMRTSLAEDGFEQNIFVIRNGRLKPTFRSIDYDLADISVRSISSLTRNQGVGDVEHIYHFSKQNDIGFHLAFIDSDFEYFADHADTLQYMRLLYDYGYRSFNKDQLWHSLPPSVQPLL